MAIKPENARTLDRSVTLLALTAVATVSFGLRVLILAGIAVCSAMLTEFICLYIRKIPFRLQHLDAATTGLLLTMLFPATISYSVLSISCIFAIIIGREVFGGNEQRMFFPAAVGYCFALVTWKEQVLQCPPSGTSLPLAATLPLPDAASSSSLWNQFGSFSDSWQEWLMGVSKLPMGSISILLLLVITGILCFRRSVSVSVVVGMLLPSVGFALLATAFSQPLVTVTATLLSNQLLFCVIYLYGDRSYAPTGIAGILYGAMVALLCTFFQIIKFENAPVILAVCMQPFAEWYHNHIVAQPTKRPLPKEGDIHETSIDITVT